MLRLTVPAASRLASTTSRAAFVGTALVLSLAACERAPEKKAPPAVVEATKAAPAAVPENKPDLSASQLAFATQAAAIRSAPLSVIVLHKIKDFAAYQQDFASHADLRRSAGVLGYLISRPVDDPTHVLVHFAAESEAKMDAFFDSPELNKLLASDEAPDSSLLWLAHNVLVDLPPTPLAKSHSLYLKTPVVDFAKLQAGLTAALPGFRADGLGMLALLRSTDNASVAVLHLTAVDRPALEKIYASPAFQAALGEAGAKSERKPIYAEDVR